MKWPSPSEEPHPRAMCFLVESHPKVSPDATPFWPRPSQKRHTFTPLGALIQGRHPHYCYRSRPSWESHPHTLGGFDPGLLFSSLSQPKSSYKPHSCSYSVNQSVLSPLLPFQAQPGSTLGDFLDFTLSDTTPKMP